jgi:hypothetical protein
MKKTLRFEKETLRTLVSAELDSVVGGWASVSSPMPAPGGTVSSPKPNEKMSSAWDHAPSVAPGR